MSLKYLGALGMSDLTAANGSNSVFALLLRPIEAGFLKNVLALGFSIEEVVPLAKELSHILMVEDGIPIRPENGSIGVLLETSIKSSPFRGFIGDGGGCMRQLLPFHG